MKIEWTDHIKGRIKIYGFDLEKIENIIHYSSEQYVDTETGRIVVIGRHDKVLALIAYEQKGDLVTPVTVHKTTRLQIKSRIKRRRLLI